MLLKPLNTAIHYLEFVAAGDLTQTLPAMSRNELRRLNAALHAMQQSLAHSVGRVRETMSVILTQTENVNVLMKKIAQASHEQSHGIDQVNIAVTQMEDVAQHNASLVEEAAMATRSLEEQSQQLILAMDVFKVKRDAQLTGTGQPVLLSQSVL